MLTDEAGNDDAIYKISIANQHDSGACTRLFVQIFIKFTQHDGNSDWIV